MKTTYPLLRGFAPSDVIGWANGTPVSAARFCAAALELADALPKKRLVMNLCNDRLNFLLGLAAALIAGQVSLLPHSRTAATLNDVIARHPGSYCLADDADLPSGLAAMMLPPWPAYGEAAIPEIAGDQIAITAFTSGTTGQSQAHSRSWASFALAAQLANRRICIPAGACLLGTVPPQHMYGLEHTVMLTLQNGLCVHGSRPLLPADVDAALREIAGERWLVTTPVHLRACLGSGMRFPPLAGVLSATMPLSRELAAEVEQRWETAVHEIYGSTETGTVALRRTAQGDTWRAKDGVTLEQKGEETWASGGHLFQPMKLGDRIGLASATEFTLLGRPQDMVKVAGKRASLEVLNQELLRVPGVRDGVFFAAEDAGNENPGNELRRLAAVVVAPGVTEAAIRRALRERLDPAFLPRPLLIVDALPRNATGKLPREALKALAAQARPRSA